jgi:hypothetical protein
MNEQMRGFLTSTLESLLKNMNGIYYVLQMFSNVSNSNASESVDSGPGNLTQNVDKIFFIADGRIGSRLFKFWLGLPLSCREAAFTRVCSEMKGRGEVL